MTEPLDDEFPGVEMRRLTWANLPHPGGAQHGDRRWITAKEMQSPSIWSATLDTIKEGAMDIILQTLPEKVAMTACDKARARQRDRPRFDVVPER